MIRWGFIGCGDVVQKKSGMAFVVEGKSEVVAVMCRTLEKAKEYAESHGIKEYYDDADKIINNENVDAIYIATTPSTHIPYAKRAIEAGKAVYVEKPMGVNVAECDEAIALAKEKDVPFFVAFYRRGLPYFHYIKALIDNKEIGDIRSLNVIQYKPTPNKIVPDWRREVSQAGGGLFHDLACHTLDALDFILGPIENAAGFSSNQRKLYDSDDVVSCTFKFKSGVMATGLWCFDVNTGLDLVQIIGNDGQIEFPVFGNTITITKGDKVETINFTHPDFIQKPLVLNVIDTLRGEATALSTCETAMRTVKIMDKILAD